MNFGISYDAPGPWAFSVTMSQGTSSWKDLTYQREQLAKRQ